MFAGSAVRKLQILKSRNYSISSWKTPLVTLPVKDDSEWCSMVNICDLIMPEKAGATHYDSSGLAHTI